MPCGHGSFLIISVLAACAACGKAGPVMGLRPLLSPPCIPPEAPRWGFPASDISRGLRGCCSGSFLAPLGDLPARRAMPACDFALHASFHVRACSPKAGGRRIGCGKSQEWRLVDGEKYVVGVRLHAAWESVQKASSHDRAPMLCGMLM